MKRLLLLLGDLRHTTVSRTDAWRSLAQPACERSEREFRFTLKALARGWPGLLLFALVVLVAFMLEGR